MEENLTCPSCHVTIKSTDYYCYNCGKNLKPTPPSVSIESQIMLYLKSFLLPPFGILWAYKYLRQADRKSKIVGLAAIAVTLFSLILTVKLFFDFTSKLNNQLNGQMQGLDNLY